MRLYAISEEDALAVVTSPDLTTTGADGKPNAMKAIGARMLRAVYVVEGNRVILITIHPRD